MIIKIENLKLRTYIGIYDWEKENVQDVVINIEMEFDGSKAGKSDNIEDTINYKKITKEIINYVERGKFNLLERLVTNIGELIMKDDRVLKSTIRVDKPGALRFTDSVSVTNIIEHK
jgi:D-erythro-7,8-dihydroneopterin triphosphate epimerase